MVPMQRRLSIIFFIFGELNRELVHLARKDYQERFAVINFIHDGGRKQKTQLIIKI
jgi:hypothetical protein